MKAKNYFLLLTVSFLFLLFLWNRNELLGSESKNVFHNQRFLHSIENKFQTGDIILRSGKGFISHFFRELSLNDKKFSHAGIIYIEGNKIFVYHILGGKPGIANELRKEPLETFCNRNENNGFAVYRYDLSSDKKSEMIKMTEKLFSSKIKFDTHFDLSTDSEMYCTELVYKIVNTASGKNNYLPFTIVNSNKFIAPDNLYWNNHATLVISVDYSKKI